MPSAHTLTKMLIWCKFGQNRLSGLDTIVCYGQTCLENQFFEFRDSENGYFHLSFSLKIDFFVVAIIFLFKSICKKLYKKCPPPPHHHTLLIGWTDVLSVPRIDLWEALKTDDAAQAPRPPGAMSYGRTHFVLSAFSILITRPCSMAVCYYLEIYFLIYDSASTFTTNTHLRFMFRDSVDCDRKTTSVELSALVQLLGGQA